MTRETDPRNIPPRVEPWSIEVCETCGYYFADCDTCSNGAALAAYKARQRARAIDALNGYEPNALTMPIVKP
jgi:hypothetical protein